MRVFLILGLCAGCATVERLSPDGVSDATVSEPDATVGEPDATVDEPDATVDEPDATVGEPDATVGEPDATVEPSCDDGQRNGDETGVDCGGTTCDPCAQSICDRQPGLWCQSFEDDTYTTTPGSTGTLELAASGAYHGDSALRVQSTGAGQVASVQASFAPTSSGDLHLRAYLNIPSSVTATHADLFTLNVPAAADAAAEHCAVALQAAGILLWCISDGQLAVVDTALPRDQWVCVEWKLGIGAPGTSELFVDGTSVGSASGTTMLSRPFEQAQVGLAYTSAAQTAIEVLYDEVVIDTKPIGCD